MEKARAHITVSGRVQGVFYRGYTQGVAISLGLTGWVRNLQDGRVEAVFEGSRDKIELVIAECRMGPPSASVTDIEVDWEQCRDEFKDFNVRFY